MRKLANPGILNAFSGINPINPLGSIGSNLWSAAQPYVGSVVNPLRTAVSTLAQPLIDRGVSAAETNMKGYMGDLMSKYAPYLALPMAWGLINSGGNDQPAQPQQPNPYIVNNNYGYRDGSDLAPQTFKQAMLRKRAGSIPSVLLGAAIERQTNKPATPEIKAPQPSNIKAEDKKTEKLLQHPEVRQYVESLIND